MAYDIIIIVACGLLGEAMGKSGGFFGVCSKETKMSRFFSMIFQFFFYLTYDFILSSAFHAFRKPLASITLAGMQ